MDLKQKKSVRALVITGFGLNCEKETECALREAGADVTLAHLNDVLAGQARLADFHVLAFIGGFSFGDHLGAGTVFSNRVKSKLADQIQDFVAAGKLLIGICNGFQTMTRLGIIPALNDGGDQEVALAQNARGVFRDDWVTLVADPDSPCVFTKGIKTIELPIRHGEGRFIPADERVLAALEAQHLAVLRYADPETGKATQEFPFNPNGSVNAIAGICDPSGRVFGLMPHPEAYLSPYNHPLWTRQKLAGSLPEKGLGQQIFDNAVAFAAEHLL
ncbi:MAG: phosphoribosylformylglycinamidine synthase subunit PurQ [Lentisphaeria bacterium]|nr:phosphoribosylformylglycinamidine synthase subunit PurQ [Lentisphaeria bacterium]